MTGTDGSADLASLDRRLRAVERALTDADGDAANLPDLAALAERIAALEDRVESVEDRLEEQEAALQAVRGYVGSVRAVNRDVEERADAAIAAVRSLERRVGTHDGPRPRGGSDPDGTVDTRVYDRLSGGSAARRRDRGRRTPADDRPGGSRGTSDDAHDRGPGRRRTATAHPGTDGGDEARTGSDGDTSRRGSAGGEAGDWAGVVDDGGIDGSDRRAGEGTDSAAATGSGTVTGPGDDGERESPEWITITADPGPDPTVEADASWSSGDESGSWTTTGGAGDCDDAGSGARHDDFREPDGRSGRSDPGSRSSDDGPRPSDRGRSSGSTTDPGGDDHGQGSDPGRRGSEGDPDSRDRHGSADGPDFSPGDWPAGGDPDAAPDPGKPPDGPGDESDRERGGESPDRTDRRGGESPDRTDRRGGRPGAGNAGTGRDGDWEWPPDDRRDVESAAPWGAPDPVQPSEFETDADTGEDDEGLLARLQGVL